MADEINISIDELFKSMKHSGALPESDYYQYYHMLSQRKILINEPIDPRVIENVYIPLLEFDNDGTGEPIEIILNTPGGNVLDGMALCDIIDHLKTPTTITVLTYAYSMGAIILMAGANNPNVHKRCYKHSTAMIHAGQVQLQGNAPNVKDQYGFSQKFEELIRDYTISHTNITNEEYDRMERYEVYMTSDVMLEKGLVDEIIGVTDTAKET